MRAVLVLLFILIFSGIANAGGIDEEIQSCIDNGLVLLDEDAIKLQDVVRDDWLEQWNERDKLFKSLLSLAESRAEMRAARAKAKGYDLEALAIQADGRVWQLLCLKDELSFVQTILNKDEISVYQQSECNESIQYLCNRADEQFKTIDQIRRFASSRNAYEFANDVRDQLSYWKEFRESVETILADGGVE